MSNSDEDSACSSAPSARGRHKAWSRAFKELFPQLMKKLSAMQNTYIYQDLAYHDDIRILKIMCGDQAAPLKCMLLPSALPTINGRPSSSTSKMHDYFALSYCWGREEPTHPITMYDEQLQKLTLSNSIFYIQENVAAALRHFRREDADVNIWIDALCINQANDDEKTAQVSRMHEIYSTADYVCVWLGAGKPETRDTFRFLNTILELERLDRLIDNEQSLESWINSMSLDILCRHWAPGPTAFTPRQILELEKAGQKTEPESLPTWIPRIEGHAFWGRSGIQYGRSRRNGDSFVADLERQIRRPYNASKSLPPNIKFGRLRPPNQKTQWKRNPQKDTPEKSYLAGIVDPRSSRLGKYDGTLHVRGFKLGIIEKLSGRVLNGVIPGEALRYGGWPEEPKSGSFPTATNVPDRLWRTLVADRGPYGDNAPRWYRRACVEVLINVNSNGDLNTEVLLGLEDLPTAIREYMTRIQEVTWNRKFFLAESRTGESLYGLAPPGARYGDDICIFFGCSVPVIVRKVSSKQYQFVGECYVHAAMKGEAIQGEMKSEYFILI
ncbi:uncharacterized protein PAC_18121 [Phialocephala subalpina]|uniref:Heterokaryon incompatibility domain-containing protein n=1 Tax=Phialocephala subalpina TaxID=576137 RepID=A0A1L7XT70_9HELO|nr:uncharacterized protein PAC_18121 [Phialocephala subalpina]